LTGLAGIGARRFTKSERDVGFLRFSSSGGAILSPSPAGAASSAPADALAWSSPATWGGTKPGARDVVKVPAGRTLLIDENIDVAALEIQGTVLFAPRDLHIKTHGILVNGNGVLRAGDAERAFDHRLVFTLGTGSDRELIDGLGSKFMAAMDGGSIELFGKRRPGWVMLGDTAVPGAIIMRLNEPVDWSPGDKIAIASGGVDLPLVEERTVFAVTADGLRVTLDAPLQHRHEGRNARVRHTSSNSIAKVVLLSRSIVIEGDVGSTRSGYGAHVMIAGHAPNEPSTSVPGGSRGCFIGVEFRRVGQFNHPGRYPAHWHGNKVARGSVLADCVIHQSFQRGVVVSGTRGVKLHGNVVYKPLGHGIIVDQSEDSASILTTNLTVRPRRVRFADPGMRSMYERRPRSVWFADAVKSPRVDSGGSDSATS
jgi:hypothetical protein